MANAPRYRTPAKLVWITEAKVARRNPKTGRTRKVRRVIVRWRQDERVRERYFDAPIPVAVAASSAFSTPMATPTNTMVLTPGGYRFSDYLKAGFPLRLIVFAITMVIVPLLYRG